MVEDATDGYGVTERSMPRRQLGTTAMSVSPVAMGCWPIGGAGAGVSEGDAIATIRTAFYLGVNHFDGYIRVSQLTNCAERAVS